MNVVGWRAWYEDGSTYSSAEWACRDLPSEGMVGVLEYLDQWAGPGVRYRRIIDGGDWYWWDGERWQRVETHKEWGKYAPAPPDVAAALLKRSGVMDDGAWAGVQREMMEARTWP